MIIRDLDYEHQIFDEDQRTPPLFSLPGSIAASFGIGVNDLGALYGGRGQDHGYLITKWRTPAPLLNPLQTAVNIATADAKIWRMDDVPEGDEDIFPGCLISARAIIHASANSHDFAVDLYERMNEMRPAGWERSEERVSVMQRYQAALHTQDARMIDHQTIEGAICRMIGFQPKHLAITGLVDKRRAVDLVNGRTLWRQDEVDDVLFPALYEVGCQLQNAIPYDLDWDDDHLEAMAALSPTMAATAWQLWPSLRPHIEAASPWFSVFISE